LLIAKFFWHEAKVREFVVCSWQFIVSDYFRVSILPYRFAIFEFRICKDLKKLCKQIEQLPTTNHKLQTK
jgi:hypothetical protein